MLDSECEECSEVGRSGIRARFGEDGDGVRDAREEDIVLEVIVVELLYRLCMEK